MTIAATCRKFPCYSKTYVLIVRVCNKILGLELEPALFASNYVVEPSARTPRPSGQISASSPGNVQVEATHQEKC